MEPIDEFLRSIRKKTMLVVFPHPDDEAMMTGGLVVRARELGFAVTILCLTCGEKGEDWQKDSSRNLASKRSEEFFAAADVLGVKRAVLWNYCDGNLKRERSWEQPLEEFIDRFKPGVVVSYDLFGVTGHDDHQSVAKKIYDWYRKKKKWQLMWPVHEEFFEGMMMKSKGMKKQRVTWELKLNAREMLAKWRAVRAHASQALHREWWRSVRIWHRIYTSEAYVQAV